MSKDYKECSEKGRNKILEMRRSARIYPDWLFNEIYLEEDKERARKHTLSSKDRILFKCNCCGKPFEQLVCNRVQLSNGERTKYSNGMRNQGFCRKCADEDLQKKSNSTFRCNGYRSFSEMAFHEDLCNLGYNAFHKPRAVGLREADIIIGNRIIEFDGIAHHEEHPWIKPGKNRMGSGKYPGYHRSKDFEAEKRGYIVYHVCTEDFEKHPVREANKIIRWLDDPYASTKPSKFDLTR